MKFDPVPIDQSLGKILGHNVAGPDGRRILRKGKALTGADIAKLKRLGRKMVYVAELEPGDIDEDSAAQRVALTIQGSHMQLSSPIAGRVNLSSLEHGLFRVDRKRLAELNSYQGVTVATLANNTVVERSKMVATVKILPYALPEKSIAALESGAHDGRSTLTLEPFQARSVGLILSGSPSSREKIVHSFKKSLGPRLEALKASIEIVDFIPLEDVDDEAHLASAIRSQAISGIDLIILAGETAIMDRHDIAPRAVEKAGGNVVCYGAPVDPGNLLMLAYLGDLPIMGAPGCARSPKTNIVDLLLPRLLLGKYLGNEDIVHLGHGGLLEDISDRPMPRNRA